MVQLVLIVMAVVVALYVSCAVHEVGHAVVALAIGSRVRTIEIGHRARLATLRVRRLRFIVRLFRLAGVTHCEVPRTRPRRAWLALGGVGANAVVAALGLVAIALNAWSPPFVLLVITNGAGVMNLIPWPPRRTMKGGSDAWVLAGVLVGGRFTSR